MLEEKLNEYVDEFNENLPLFMMPPMTDDELIELIDNCLKSSKPYKVDVGDDPEDAVY